MTVSTEEPTLRNPWEDAVKAVPHALDCAMLKHPLGWSHPQFCDYVLPCDCDRDVRTAKGIEAARESDKEHIGEYAGQGVYACRCGWVLTKHNGPLSRHHDNAALAAFAEASR